MLSDFRIAKPVSEFDPKLVKTPVGPMIFG